MAGNTVKDMTTNFGKLDKFEGHDFRRWQKKMHFLLTTLKVVYVLTTPMPELVKDATMEAIRIRAKWKNDDYICRGHMLNGMSDSLFDVYTNVESAKELWDSLESKYMAEDSSSKKFLDFKHTLKHGKDDLSLVQLGSYLRIEESIRAQESDKGKVDAITWWIDSGATTHMCKDRCWFKTYEPVEDGSVLYMDDDHFAPVHGKRSVALDFSSGKTITLFNVLYVPKLQAINDAIGSIMENNTWVLYDLPPGCKPLGCKWIFKRKMKVDGSIDKFKARLVIQGFRQKEEIDYFDTYALVAHITTIRLLLALVAIHNLVIYQMDVKTAFLNGNLDEEMYMKQPKGFVMPDMREADVILGIKIKRENEGIVITQSHYIEKILKKFNREDCSPVSTPIDLVEKLKPNTGKRVDQLEYSRAIGCLMYAMTSTRPDIVYVGGRLSRFTSNPSRQHRKAITRDSKKKICITSSTMESEFVALAAAGKKAKWLRNSIHKIPIWTKPIATISIRCDSAPTMARAYSQIYNENSRYLGARSKGTIYVNMKFRRFKKLGLSFLYVHQWIGTYGL
uniref:Uncharacterized protein n=1 Tax=Tanacetum cinerariifolium TaxID=118510 RepID=A0A699HBP0_TANCI|nr:hypothetical protein [Tanacetum cinerariifolium]